MHWHRGIFTQGHCLYRFCSAPARCTSSLSTGDGGSRGPSESVDNRGAGGGHGLPECISAWECMRFVSPQSADVGAEGLRLTITRRMPLINQPDHVLVRVEAASLNPVDILMLKGYGAQSFRCIRQLTSLAGLAEASPPEFPLTPGRDFAGEIVDLGPTARLSSTTTLRVGQKVAGATWPHLSSSGSGALAEYLVCPTGHLAAIPPPLLVAHDGVQSAAAVGYAGLTAWSALTCAGGMQARVRAPTGQGPLVLVNAATGGIGLIAAQLARLWGARVHVTCRGDRRAVELMDSFGFDEVIVYPDTPSFSTAYDIIIDCIRPDYLDSSSPGASSGGPPGLVLPDLFGRLRPGVNSRYVCLNPPLLHYMDTWGPVLGAGVATGFALGGMLSAWLAAASGLSSSGNNWPPGQLRWAFFKADGARLDQLLRWLASGQLRVPIDTVLPFAQAPQAFARLQAKGVRGKVVVVRGGTPH